jgi:chromosome partitioning protein
VLPTFLDQRLRQSGEMLAQLRGHFGTQLCNPIRVNVALAESFGYRESIFEYGPKSRGAEDYVRLVDRVRGDYLGALESRYGPKGQEATQPDPVPEECLV